MVILNLTCREITVLLLELVDLVPATSGLLKILLGDRLFQSFLKGLNSFYEIVNLSNTLWDLATCLGPLCIDFFNQRGLGEAV